MLILGKKYQEEIIKLAIMEAPAEACGLLAGKNGTVERLYKMTNTSDRPETCYFMDAKEQLKAMKEIRKTGLEMLGIYHSHPNSVAYPSAKDVELAFYPEVVYLIISLKHKESPEIKAYKIVDGRITNEVFST